MSMHCLKKQNPPSINKGWEKNCYEKEKLSPQSVAMNQI